MAKATGRGPRFFGGGLTGRESSTQIGTFLKVVGFATTTSDLYGSIFFFEREGGNDKIMIRFDVRIFLADGTSHQLICSKDSLTLLYASRLV